MRKFWLAFLLLVTATLAVHQTMPKHEFRYNPDIGISTYGMALAKTYLNPPEAVPTGFQGYVLNGVLTPYQSWPPLGFKILATWFKITGQSDIYIARLFYALLYGLNAVLFFVFLIRSNVSSRVAFFSTLCFIFLPSHLDFAFLIHVDQWFVTFWLLALLCFKPNGILKNWPFFLIILLSLKFVWFAIFLFPIPFILHLYRRYNFSSRQILSFLVAAVILIWGAQFFIFNILEENYLVQKFRAYSIFGLADLLNTFPIWLIKRIVSLGYEGLLLLPILLLQRGIYLKFSNYSDWPKLYYSILGMSLALFLYVICFVNWFGMHRHGIGMFSILFASLAALLLSYLEKKSSRLSNIGGLSAIIVCIILFLSLPAFTKIATPIEEQDAEIVAFINKKRPASEDKVCLFFDFPDIIAKGDFRFDMGQFAIREYTNAYTFNLFETEREQTVEKDLTYGLARLRQNRVLDFDPEAVFFITRSHQDFGSLTLVDSATVNDILIYQLDLKNY